MAKLVIRRKLKELKVRVKEHGVVKLTRGEKESSFAHRTVELRGNSIYVDNEVVQTMGDSGLIEIEGDIERVETTADVLIKGNVKGDVKAFGDVKSGDVGGNIEANGDVRCGDVEGHVEADGDVSCGDVGRSVASSGDVSCGLVRGNVSAGGDVVVRKTR